VQRRRHSASADDRHLPPLTPLPRAANIRSLHTAGSTQVHWCGSPASDACLAATGTDASGISTSDVVLLSDQPSYPTSLSAALLSAPFVTHQYDPRQGCHPGIIGIGRLHPTSPWSPSRAQRYYSGSDSCAPSPQRTGLPAYCAPPSDRSVPNHALRPSVVFPAKYNADSVFQASP